MKACISHRTSITEAICVVCGWTVCVRVSWEHGGEHGGCCARERGGHGGVL